MGHILNDKRVGISLVHLDSQIYLNVNRDLRDGRFGVTTNVENKKIISGVIYLLIIFVFDYLFFE